MRRIDDLAAALTALTVAAAVAAPGAPLAAQDTVPPAPSPYIGLGAEGKPPFVFIHGAWGGGWAWRAVDSMLTATGHRATRPTLTGLGERVHLSDPDIGPATHVQDVINHLVFERLDDVILVGHSYGGMVALAVADRVPQRVRRLVLLDAFLPDDGESVVTASRGTGTEAFIHRLVAAAGDGPIVPSWIDPDAAMPADVPQPLRTFTEPIRLGPAAVGGAAGIAGTYILTVEPGAAPESDAFAAFAERARARGWDVVVLRGDHNPQSTARAELVGLLERIADLEEQPGTGRPHAPAEGRAADPESDPEQEFAAGQTAGRAAATASGERWAVGRLLAGGAGGVVIGFAAPIGAPVAVAAGGTIVFAAAEAGPADPPPALADSARARGPVFSRGYADGYAAQLRRERRRYGLIGGGFGVLAGFVLLLMAIPAT